MRGASVSVGWLVAGIALCGCGSEPAMDGSSGGSAIGGGAMDGAPAGSAAQGGGGVGTANGSAGGAASGSAAGGASGGGGATAGLGATAGNGEAGDGGKRTPDGGTGGDGGSQVPPDAGEDAVEPTTGLFPPVSDFTRPGPYTSTTLAGVGPGGNHTVYMPVEAPPEGAGNPLVAWTSGGGTTHGLYTLLPHLASHGFVVITSNTIPGIGTEAQLGQEILAGIDWALAEHERSGSMLHGRLDTAKIASSGYSMGSLATFQIADDPRLVTTVHISGGSMAPEVVNNLHAPAAFVCGNSDPACVDLLSPSCDIAGANCARDFENAQTPVFYATFDSGHLGILTSPFMERINAMTAAWLRNHLMGDTTLDAHFRGSDCGYCGDPNWTLQRKNF